jgi:malonyl-CoA O-methyltransferase
MVKRTHSDGHLAFGKRCVRSQFARAVSTYDRAAVLQRTVADRLIERLDAVRLRPTRILDAGCGTGYCTRALARRFRGAGVVGIDLTWEMTARSRRRAGWFARSRFVNGDAEQLPFANASFDMVLSNLMLHWCDPVRVFAECLRVLRPGGLFVFTTFGPDTLRELREAWSRADQAPHVHTFLDMHDLGDILIRAGFADPVLDVERYTLTYRDVRQLMGDLKALGEQNAHALRPRGLTGRARFGRFQSAYAEMAKDGRVPATYEVVYGHAWIAEPTAGVRRARDDTTVRIPIDKIGLPR